jgi:hypothetical protein
MRAPPGDRASRHGRPVVRECLKAGCAAAASLAAAVLVVGVALPDQARANAPRIAAVAPSAGPILGTDKPVTVIGDSVMTAVLWYATPLSILQQGLDVRMEVAVCRRLTGVSCPFEGGEAPTLEELVAARGKALGPAVVVVMGYNDSERLWASSVEESVALLLKAGVKRILWATLREVRHPYVRMNETLAAASRRHPELTIIDWNGYARTHPDWFQNDGLHLTPDGGAGMATFLHDAIVRAVTTPLPLVVAPEALPRGRVGHGYATRLVAGGGTAPYRWRIARGSLPAGLELDRDGRIRGTPVRPSRVSIVLVASDATGQTASFRGVIVVAR